MEPMLAEFRKVLSSVSYGTPQLPIVSNVTGRLASSAELCSAEYWVQQVRSPVRFLDGVRVLEAEGVGASLELGPDGVLTALTVRCLSDASQLQAVAAQRRGRDGTEALLAALGVLHVHGVGVDWEKVAGASASRQVVGLPTYAFQRAALLAGGREGERRRLDDGAVVCCASAAWRSDAFGGQRRVPADGAVVGDGGGLAR